MSKHIHQSALPSHYDSESESYDGINEENSAIINQTLYKTLSKLQVHSIADFTCGTGSQVFFLNEKGFNIVGYDFSQSMLSIARSKAQDKGLTISFNEGDIRSVKAGPFDAVISIFNAVGHLTKDDFAKALHNIHSSLHKSGIYIFDIFNKEYLQSHDNIKNLTVDWQTRVGRKTVREIQYSILKENGVLVSFDTIIKSQLGTEEDIETSSQTLQTYSETDLEKILHECGFSISDKITPEGHVFSSKSSERILVIAKKKSMP